MGEFKIKGTHSYTPEQLWEITKDFSGITKDFFDEYFLNYPLAHAFEIDSFELYPKPKLISELVSSGKPPQSYCYIR